MSEHDNSKEPADPAEPTPAEPVEPSKPRWRDRVFRMRAVAAVAVAGLILGAAGGAATTALVSDGRGDRDDHLRIGQQFGPGMPVFPPGGRQRFPGDESEDGGMPEMPVPPRSEGGTDDGTDEESSLSRS